jgi:Plasmid encoded RepA protein
MRSKPSDARRLQDQMRRLLEARISFLQELKEEHRQGERRLNMEVAGESELWWNPRDPEQGTLWGSYVVLGERFFEAITAFPVPADMRVLRAIKRSPLALDLYAWATWRVFRVQKPAFIPWDGLMKQMGGEYDRADNFVQKAKAALRKIRAVYPALKLNYVKGGFVLHPSLTAIAPAPKKIEAERRS